MNATTRVLYVEDDPNSRTVMDLCLKFRLKLSKYTIFSDSTDFLARVQALEQRPNVVFLDIHVKPLNGFEMLKLLRAESTFASVPIVALTASVMNEEVHLLKTSGFDGCLAKPLNMDTFPEQFNQILNGERIWRVI